MLPPLYLQFCPSRQALTRMVMALPSLFLVAAGMVLPAGLGPLYCIPPGMYSSRTQRRPSPLKEGEGRRWRGVGMRKDRKDDLVRQSALLGSCVGASNAAKGQAVGHSVAAQTVDAVDAAGDLTSCIQAGNVVL